MATPRLYCNYPAEYTALFRQAIDCPVRIEFDSIDEAKRIRRHLYAFRNSIRDGDDVPDDLVTIAPLITFKIDTSALVICRARSAAVAFKALEQFKLKNKGNSSDG